MATSRREVRRFAKSPSLALKHMRLRTRVRRRDWQKVHAMLRPMSRAALAARDVTFLNEVGHAAMRLGQEHLGVELLQRGREISGKVRPTDWHGEDIGDATLIVHVMESKKQGVAVGVQMAGYVRAAASRAARTVLVVEPRMRALFQRTLPGITVVPFGADLSPYTAGRFVTAGINDLQIVFGYDAAAIAKLHLPLQADPAEAAALREKYRRGRSLPLIGISWWSSHYGKDLPTPEVWARLLREVPAQFVSLQYGDVGADIAVVNGGDPPRLIVDPDVDQLVDMDRFASQIAALDLVVTISNSGAHLAGAMNQRMILVRDDLFRRIWPYLSSDVPWYPRTRVVGKDGRPWTQAFDDVTAMARDIVGKEQQ